MPPQEDLKANPAFDAMRASVAPGPGTPARNESGRFTTDDGCRLYYDTWMPPDGPADKIVVCFHGMAGHGRYHALIADALVPHGIGVVSVDYRGHGLSEGVHGDIMDSGRIVADMRQFFSFIRGAFPGKKLFTLGESMGGAVNVNLMLSPPEGVNGMILLAPAIGLTFKFPLIQFLLVPAYLLILLLAPGAKLVKATGNERQGMTNELNMNYDRTDPQHLKLVSLRYLMNVKRLIDNARARGPAAIRIPTLVFQGGKDKGIDPNAVRTFFNNLAAVDKTLHFYDDAPHCMLTDLAHHLKLKTSLLEWLQKH